MRHALGIGMHDGVDRVPTRSGDKLFDLKCAVLHQTADRQPTTAIVGGEKRSHQALVATDLVADRLLVDIFARFSAAFDRVGDDPLF